MREIEEKEQGGHNAEGEEDALEKDGQDGFDQIRMGEQVQNAADGVQPGAAGGGLLRDSLGVADLTLDGILDGRHGGMKGKDSRLVSS